MQELNTYSKHITQDKSLPAAQAMLHGIGLTEADLKKAQVGIVSTGWEGNTCNMHLNDLAAIVKQGVQESDLVGLIFHTIGVSDGISMGTRGMSYSLQSRDLIADSIETVVGCQGFDGLVAIGGCDKNMPGCLMAMARMNCARKHGLPITDWTVSLPKKRPPSATRAMLKMTRSSKFIARPILKTIGGSDWARMNSA